MSSEDFYGPEDEEEFDGENDPSATPPAPKKMKKIEEKVVEEETSSVQTRTSIVKHRFIRPRPELKTDEAADGNEETEKEQA